MPHTSNLAPNVITDPSEVVLALNSPNLVPPPCPTNLKTGPTATLRSAMARFSHGDQHEGRRLAIDAAISSVTGFPFKQRSLERTQSFLDALPTTTTAGGDEQPDEATLNDIAQIIPTETLADALGVADADLGEVRRDIGLLAATIGRGAAASEESDCAATRLQDRFASHPGGPVATVSLLYQNHDATAALLIATHESCRTDTARRSALRQTFRVVESETILQLTQPEDGSPDKNLPEVIALPVGATVALSLQDLQVEFGAGPHHCPGKAMAQEIAAGIIVALGYR